MLLCYLIFSATNVTLISNYLLIVYQSSVLSTGVYIVTSFAALDLPKLWIGPINTNKT